MQSARQSVLGRWLRRIVYSILAVLALVSLAYLTRDAWTGAVLARVLDSAGLRADVAEVEWTGARRVELRGVRISGTGDVPALRVLTAERIAVELDPWTLWREGLRGLASIEAERVEAIVDVSTTAPSTQADDGTSFDVASLSPLPRVDMKDVSLELHLPSERMLVLREANLAVMPRASAIAPRSSAIAPRSDIELHVRDLETSADGRSVAHPFAMRAGWTAGVVELEELVWQGEIARARGRIDLSKLHLGALDATLEIAALGGEASLELRLADEALAVRGDVDALSVARVLRAALPNLALTVDAQLDLALDVTIPLSDPIAARGEVLVDAFDIQLGERRLDWMRASIVGRERTLDAPEVFVAQGANRLHVRDFSIPRDALDLCGLLELARAHFDAELEDLPRALNETASIAGPLELAQHRVRLAGSWIEGALEIQRGQLVAGENRVRVRRGHVPLDAIFDPAFTTRAVLIELVSDPRSSLDLVVRVENLEEVAAAIGASGIEGSVDAAVRLTGSAQGPRGFADIQAHDLLVRGRAIGSVSGHCEFDRDRVDVTHLSIDGDDANMAVRGRYFWNEGRFEDARVHAWVRDLAAFGNPSWPSGIVEIDADWNGSGAGIEGLLRIQSGELTWGEQRVARAEIHAHMTPRNTEFVARVDDRDLGLVSIIGRLDGALAEAIAAREACLYVRDFRWSESVELLALSRPVECVIGPDTFALSDLELAGRSGVLIASVGVAEDVLRVRATAHALEITPWLTRFVRETAQCRTMDAEIDVSWAPGTLEIDGEGKLQGVRWSADSTETEIDFELGLHDAHATIEAFDVSTADGAALTLTGAFPLNLTGGDLLPDGAISIAGRLSVPDLGLVLPRAEPPAEPKRGTIEADVAIEGTWADPRGHVTLAARDVANVFGRASTSLGTCGLDLALALGSEIVIERGEITLLSGADVDLSGRIGAPWDVPTFLERGTKVWDEAALDLRVVLALPDLSPLAAIIPELRRMGGAVHGEFALRGTLLDPDLHGSLQLSDGELRLASDMPALTGFSARLVLERDRVHVEEFRGEMGGAPVDVSGTVSNLQSKPELDLTAHGENVLLYRTYGFMLRADADLSVRGPLDALAVGGSLAVRDSRYTRDFDLLSVGRGSRGPTPTRGQPLFQLDPPFDALRFDVDITSREPFQIRNNVVRGSLRADLELGGTGALPILRGSVTADAGRVSLPTGTAHVRSGRVDYRASDPFVPDIEALAEMRLQGYDITMRVSGDLEQPKIDISSLPPLSREDLMLLVLTNRPPGEQLSLRSGQRAATEVAVFIARDVVSDWFDGGATGDDESFADNLEVETGQEVSQSGVDTVRARLKILEGKLGERASLYVTGERDIYEHYNFGVRFLLRFQ